MKEESLLLLSDLQKLINQVVLIDYTIIILGGKILKECLVEKQEIVKEPTQQKSMHMQEYRVSRKYNISIEL